MAVPLKASAPLLSVTMTGAVVTPFTGVIPSRSTVMVAQPTTSCGLGGWVGVPGAGVVGVVGVLGVDGVLGVPLVLFEIAVGVLLCPQALSASRPVMASIGKRCFMVFPPWEIGD
ncbi:hypothetical protein GCM10008939_16130 [Deinococcus aquiradiocola]|uniref:Uncharacterized protein n=1 Tax=Deinococcus aquiradiocola TaxID=393059 RepID=A0A917PEK5_9DEIO|nr:hypothetical protein GCM10008939_16130 [Deinococcus aquiradiocola]